MKKITVFILFCLFLTAAVFAEGPGKGEFQIAVSALKGPSGIGMIKLFKDNPVFGNGIHARYETAGAPDVLVSRILSGEVDIATLPTNVAVKLYNKGVPYYLGAVTGYGLLYLLSSDPQIKSIQDLKGMDVYNIGQGATPDFLFRYLVQRDGLDPSKDLNIRFTYGHPELAQSLIAGRVKTGILPEPFVTMVVMKNPDVRIAVDLQKLWRKYQPGEGSYPMTVVVVKKSLLADHPAAVADFLDAYKQSIQWVKDNPKAAGQLSEKYGIGMPAPVAAAAVPRLNLAFVPGNEAKSVLEPFLQVFLNFDPVSIGGKLPDNGFYTGTR